MEISWVSCNEKKLIDNELLPVIKFQLEVVDPVPETSDIVELRARESSPQLRWFSQLMKGFTAYGRYSVCASHIEGVTFDMDKFKIANANKA